MLLRWHSGRRVVLARHAVGVSRPDGCDRGPAAHYADIDEALAARYPYQRAYLPVNRLQHDGTLWSW